MELPFGGHPLILVLPPGLPALRHAHRCLCWWKLDLPSACRANRRSSRNPSSWVHHYFHHSPLKKKSIPEAVTQRDCGFSPCFWTIWNTASNPALQYHGACLESRCREVWWMEIVIHPPHPRVIKAKTSLLGYSHEPLDCISKTRWSDPSSFTALHIWLGCCVYSIDLFIMLWIYIRLSLRTST